MMQRKALEVSIYSWTVDQWKFYMPVSTTGIIDRVILVYPELKGGDENNRIYWVLKFLKSSSFIRREKNSPQPDN